jgi:hypothetical protein
MSLLPLLAFLVRTRDSPYGPELDVLPPTLWRGLVIFMEEKASIGLTRHLNAIASIVSEEISEKHNKANGSKSTFTHCSSPLIFT